MEQNSIYPSLFLEKSLNMKTVAVGYVNILSRVGDGGINNKPCFTNIRYVKSFQNDPQFPL